jgi:hypothetical protein
MPNMPSKSLADGSHLQTSPKKGAMFEIASQIYPGRMRIGVSQTQQIALLLAVYFGSFVLMVPIFAKPGAAMPLDKAAAVLCTPLAFLGLARAIKSKKLLAAYLAGYFSLLLLSSAVAQYRHGDEPYPLLAPLLGILTDAKPYVFAFFFYELLSRHRDRWEQDVLHASRVILLFALFNGLFELRDLLVGGQSIWGFQLGHSARGVPIPLGIFYHKYWSACLTMFGALAALGELRKRRTPARIAAFVFLLALLALSEAAKESFAVVLATAVLVAFPGGRRGTERTSIRLLIGAMSIVVATAFISNLSTLYSKRYHDYSHSDTVRWALNAASFSIAVDEFPIGAGAGTFASSPSRNVYYSPLYYRYNIFAMYQAGPTNSAFLQDVWWPHVLAESGFVGALFYLGIAAYPLWCLFPLVRRRDSNCGFFLFSSAAAIVINSVAASTFSIDLLMPIIGLVWGAAMAQGNVRRPPAKLMF